MQSIGQNDLRISKFDFPKKVMYNIKEALQTKETLDVSSGTGSSGTAARAVESLKRLGYITIENVQTFTVVEKGKRIIKLVITVKKTADFAKLYKEHEEDKKKREEENKAQQDAQKKK